MFYEYEVFIKRNSPCNKWALWLREKKKAKSIFPQQNKRTKKAMNFLPCNRTNITNAKEEKEHNTHTQKK